VARALSLRQRLAITMALSYCYVAGPSVWIAAADITREQWEAGSTLGATMAATTSPTPTTKYTPTPTLTGPMAGSAGGAVAGAIKLNSPRREVSFREVGLRYQQPLRPAEMAGVGAHVLWATGYRRDYQILSVVSQAALMHIFSF
jgi:hypothetical protein